MRPPRPYEQDQLLRTGKAVSVEHERIFIFETRNGAVEATVIDRAFRSLRNLFSQEVHLTLPLWPNDTQG